MYVKAIQEVRYGMFFFNEVTRNFLKTGPFSTDLVPFCISIDLLESITPKASKFL